LISPTFMSSPSLQASISLEEIICSSFLMRRSCSIEIISFYFACSFAMFSIM
jgi:hypothetical protein